MTLVYEHRTLLGVDVVGSASNPGHHLKAVPEVVHRVVAEALRSSGIDDDAVVDWQATGDGALVTLPNSVLGLVLDATQRLDVLVASHNRSYKPDIRCRVAVGLGPVDDAPGFYAPTIELCRLLDAAEFKSLFTRCREVGIPDLPHTALIVSEGAFRAVYAGDHTEVLREHDFTSLRVSNKEHVSTGWVRVPGFDRRTVSSFAEECREATTQDAEEYHGRKAEIAPGSSTVTVGGNNSGVAAGYIGGDANVGGRGSR